MEWLRDDLHEALIAGDAAEALYLIEQGADVNAPRIHVWLNGQYRGEKPIHYAADQGFDKVIQQLINHGADVNALGLEQQTALHNAAREGHVSTIQILIKNNCNVHIKDWEGFTALNRGADGHGCIEIFQLLFAAGADLNEASDSGERPIDNCAKSRKINEIKFLLQNNVDLCGTKLNGQNSSLHYAVDPEIVNLFLEAGCEVNAQNAFGETPLIKCLTNYIDCLLYWQANDLKYYEVVELLYQNGASNEPIKQLKQSKDVNDAHFLHAAAFIGHAKLLEYLISVGYGVNDDGDEYGTPLINSIRKNNIECAQILLEKGADVYQTSEHSRIAWMENALDFAVTSTRPQLLSVVFAKAVPPVSQYYASNSKIFIRHVNHCFKRKQYNHISIFCQQFSELILEHSLGSKAMAALSFGGCSEDVQRLIKAGVDVNQNISCKAVNFGMQKNLCLQSFLQLAAYNGKPKIINVLIKAGAETGKTELRLALESGNGEALKLILQAIQNSNKDLYQNLNIFFQSQFRRMLFYNWSSAQTAIQNGADVDIQLDIQHYGASSALKVVVDEDLRFQSIMRDIELSQLKNNSVDYVDVANEEIDLNLQCLFD